MPDIPYLSYLPGWTLQVDRCATLRSARVAHAAYRKADGTTMFFADHIVAHLKSKDEEPARPTVLILWWPALPKVRIHVISAALPDPNQHQNHHVHIFSRDLYVQFNELNGEVVQGPRPISESWLALAEAGFVTVDAVISYQSDMAVFFSGERYAIVAFEFLENGPCSRLIESGTFASRWPVLSTFKSIDCILPEPETSCLVFFSGQEYISIGENYFRSDSSDLSLDQVVLPAGTPEENSLPADHGSIVDLWPALARVGFYARRPVHDV